jgi:hypothetical protein
VAAGVPARHSFGPAGTPVPTNPRYEAGHVVVGGSVSVAGFVAEEKTVDVLIILVILFGPIVLLVYLYKYLVSTPLPRWLNLPIGYFAPVVAVTLIIPLLQIRNNYWYWCNSSDGFFAKIGCAISEMYKEDAQYFRFLPSDETMIAHFQKHRADFERLVQIYQEDQSPPDPVSPWSWKPTPQARAIMERIGVSWMTGDRSMIWVTPDPYSKEAGDKARTFDSKDRPETRKFTAILFGYDHAPVKRLNEYLSQVKKYYYYIPVVQNTKNGFLTASSRREEVFPTLNTYPPDLGIGDSPCAYRQFELQWFIKMCQYDK